MEADAAAPQPSLRRRDGVGIIVGIVIGAGIFKTPSMVAGTTADGGWAIAAWIAGALLSLAGALCYAELASAYRHAGGDYHFLTRAYGRDASFLYAWARATVINTGAIALLAFVFGDYVSIYNFHDAIADGATVPLYYENRIPELQLINPDLNSDIEGLIAAADLDEDQERKLEREFAREYHLLTRDDRLEKIAEDIVAHFQHSCAAIECVR